VAQAFLDGIRRQHHAATHHCSAWRVGPPESNEERFDDDGEPSGTAGRPILSALEQAQLHEVVAVVTRWYGGTKLGTGGLARAYLDVSRAAVDGARRRVVHREAEIEIHADYELLGTLEAFLGRESARVRGVERLYGDETVLRVRVLRSHGPSVLDRLRQYSAGKARCTLRELS
jgi:uncharacterized YigZ family protein